MSFHPWLNALHLVSAIVWIGGMLVMAVVVGWSALQSDKTSTVGLLLAVRRWSRKVVTPAMLLLWMAGAIMVIAHGQFPHLWLVVKIVAVIALSGLHGFLSATIRRMAASEPVKGSGAVRNATTLIIVVVAGIILLAVFRPF